MPLIADQTAVLTHIAYNGEADTDVESTVTLSGISWYSSTQASATSDGLAAASIYRMRIFCGHSTAKLGANSDSVSAEGSYTTPSEWSANSAEIRAATWTAAPGDKVTCNGVTATVLAVHDNRGSRRVPHIYLEAK